MEYVRGGRVDGVQRISVRAEDVLPGMLADAGPPMVLLGSRSGGERVVYVGMDNVTAHASRSATRPAVAGFEDFEPAEQTEPSLFTAAGSRPVGRPDVPCPGRTVRRLADAPSGIGEGAGVGGPGGAEGGGPDAGRPVGHLGAPGSSSPPTYPVKQRLPKEDTAHGGPVRPGGRHL